MPKTTAGVLFQKISGNHTIERAIFEPTKTKEGRWLLDSRDFMFPADFTPLRSAALYEWSDLDDEAQLLEGSESLR